MQAGRRFIFVAALLGSSLLAGDLFPLQEGNSWTYREARTGGTFTVQVGASAALNGQTYYPLTGYVPQPVMVRIDDQGRLVYVDPASGQEAVLTYLAPPDSGGWWDAPLRMCGEQAQTLEKRGTFDGAIGVVNGVVELQYKTLTCADAGDLSEQYAENIGMVRRVTQSIAGPRQYDLIHAKVGEIVIDGLPHAQFSVTVDDRAASANLVVTLRLQTNSPLPLKLQFSSGQEYDLVLRASDGTSVWQWSAGRSFIESLHERMVTGEWSVTVAVPRPPAASDPNAVTYTLQGWLTTTGNTSQFASTIPLP